MTTYNQPKRPDRRNHTNHPRPGGTSPEQASVPRARDELERERELYSAHDPNRNPATPTPAQKWNEAHSSWHGWQGTGSIPAVSTMRSTDTSHTASGANTQRSSYNSAGSTGASRPIGRNGQSTFTGKASSGSGRVFVGSSREYLSGGSSATDSSTAMDSSSAANLGSAESIQSANSKRADAMHPKNASRQSNTANQENAAEQANFADQESAAENVAGATTSNATEQASATEQHTATNNESSTKNQASASNTGAGGAASGTKGKTIPPRKPTKKPAAIYGANNRYQGRGPVDASRQVRLTRTGLIAALAVVVVAIIGVFAFQNYEATKAVAVTLNGESVTVAGDQRSPEGILNAGLVSVTPGNYIAVDKSVIREGEGTRATVTLNGEKTDDLSTHLKEGDQLKFENGTDVMESFTESETEVLPYSTKIKGTGAVHLYMNEGKNGEKVVRTGNESGITAETVTQKPVNRTIQRYNVDTGGDKVIALTFDDGPWDSSTEKILDILDENGAKATFFTVGYKIPGRENLVKRAADAGHEIGTHTWDHAEGSGKGVSLIKMSSDERKEEVTKGLKAIEDATGSKASTTFRAPGGNFDESVATDLQELISSEIGWNVDTNDWQKPGASTIAQRIESAGPGSIVLMHDGGGDRSQTVAALKEALPVLKEEGYSFITVKELIEKYPYKES